MIPIAHPQLGEAEKRLLAKVIDSGRLAQGPMVAKFEEQVASLSKAKHAIALANGTVALDLAMRAAGLKAGDEVITTPFTFVATANAILSTGAKPVFVDIDPVTFNIDPAKVKAALSAKTKAIVPVDLYGQTYDADPILALAKERKLSVIEDAAQAIGASYGKRMAGTLGDMGTFSFYATKNITTGEGGIVLTDDDEKASLLRVLRNQGQHEKIRYEYLRLGYNCRMTELQAAVGVAQMERFEAITKARQRNAAALDKGLKGVKGITIPSIAKGRTHVYHQYTIMLPAKTDRAKFIEHLTAKGVGHGIYYPKVLYAYEYLKPFAAKCPNAEAAAARVVSLPVHADLSQKDLKTIIDAVASFG